MATIETNHESASPAQAQTSAAEGSSPALPCPRDFPDADVLIYDGKCVFCQKQVKNLQRLDRKNRLAFVSLHDEFVANHFPDLTYDQMMQEMYLIPSASDQAGYSAERHGGVAAIRYLTCRLPKLWILWPLMHIPFTKPIWQWGYTLIANHRYKNAGKSDSECDENGTCELHFKD